MTAPALRTPSATPRMLLAILGAGLLLRLVHLASAIRNPLTYHLGPDEDFLVAFAKNVASTEWGMTPMFAFVDPLYGYLLGSMFMVVGENQFVVYLLQIMVDCATIYGIYWLGRRLWSQRAGLLGAGLYALCSTAIFYTTTLLKPTLVAGFVVLWCVLSLQLWRSSRSGAWVGFGLYLGLCVALRSNLILLAAISLAMIPLSYGRELGLRPQRKDAFASAAMLGLGLTVMLALLAARNNALVGQWSVLPPNGGVVLHQHYNEENPRSVHYVPSFVPYRHPREIWLGYEAEAQKRLGRTLNAAQISAYWNEQGRAYIAEHPGQSISNVLRKSLEFFAAREVANNRSLEQDEAFSSVLAYLPRPFVWLVAMGIPGLILLAWQKKWQAVPLLAAIGVILATFAVFIATARFRFHAVPLFAVGSGVFLAFLYESIHSRRIRMVSVILIGALACGAVSVALSQRMPNDPLDPVNLAWGYLRMGEPDKAALVARQTLESNSQSAPAHSVLGFIAQAGGHHEAAISHYRNAVQHAPKSHQDYYNLALSLRQAGHLDEAREAILTALRFRDLPDYRDLANALNAGGG